MMGWGDLGRIRTALAYILADRFAMGIHHEISPGPLRDLPLIGSVDQFADSTDVLARAQLARAITAAAIGGPR